MFTKIIYTFFFLVAISFNAQSKTGIQFQTKNLEEAKKLAQQENKLIFIDLYTTWCGPCKLMKKNTFPILNWENFSIKISSAFTLMPKKKEQNLPKNSKS
jgi:thiol:disulfide interchange protein